MTDLRHALLDDAGVRHAFGTRDALPPRVVLRPQQVHGVAVARCEGASLTPAEADAVVSCDSDHPVGVVTADCVPVLAALKDGSTVVAIHAGWRGLAAGVVEAGIAALGNAARGGGIVAVVGPCIGACCYEVDAPVIGPLRDRFGADLDGAIRSSTGPNHWMLDLGLLVQTDLARAGIPSENRGFIRDACTRCHPDRFHSYRRDGARAGRLLHWVQPHPS